MIQLEIFMEPVSWTPARICGRVHYNPKDKEKRHAISLVAQAYDGPVINEPVILDLTFHFTPPASASKARRLAMLAGVIIPTSKDCTNMQKFFEDCLKRIVIEDDRLVQKITSQKLYAEKESIVIKIFTLKEYRNAS